MGNHTKSQLNTIWILYFVDAAFELGKIIDDRLEGMGGMTDFDLKVPYDKIQHFDDQMSHSHSNKLIDTPHTLWKNFFDPEIPDRVLIIK